MGQGHRGRSLSKRANVCIFHFDGYDVFAAGQDSSGVSKDGIEVEAISIPKIKVGVSQDVTAGNAGLFVAVWDKVISGGRFRSYDWAIKVDLDAVIIPWRIRDNLRPRVGGKVFVVNCNKFPDSPNFPMMYGAVEVFSQAAMVQYALNSWSRQSRGGRFCTLLPGLPGNADGVRESYGQALGGDLGRVHADLRGPAGRRAFGSLLPGRPGGADGVWGGGRGAEGGGRVHTWQGVGRGPGG